MQESCLPHTVGPYRVACKIGSGSFSEVYQGFDPVNNKRVALKFVSREILEDPTVLMTFEREIRLAERLKHKSIVSFHHVYFFDKYIVLAMECLSNGTLTNFKETSICGPEYTVYLRWGKEILQGLQYLHKKGISHHDIKPDNIGFDSYMNTKIIDLGLCEEFKDFCYSKCGTPIFSAPEIYWYDKYDGVKADVWSFGVTFHFLVTGQYPFIKMDKFNHFSTPQSVKNNIDNICPEPFKTIIDMALTIDPEKRPTTKELLELKVFDFEDRREPPMMSEANIFLQSQRRKTMKNIIVSPLVIRPKKLTRRVSDVTMYQNHLKF